MSVLSRLNKYGKLYIGEKPVEVKKITIAQWKELFAIIETLPALILDVLTAPQSDRAAYLVVAVERSFDEVTQIVSILTGIDTEYIEQNASLDQILEYFVQIAKINDFNAIAKNVKSVLALTIPKASGNAEPSEKKAE